MTPDLTYLTYTAVLTALVWIPYAIGLLKANAAAGVAPAATYQDPTPPDLPAWVKRCGRVHMNALETIVPFTVVVLVAHLAGAANEMTAMWAMIFFFARVAHALIYWTGIPFLRTLAFVVGLVATLGIFWEVISATPVA